MILSVEEWKKREGQEDDRLVWRGLVRPGGSTKRVAEGGSGSVIVSHAVV